MKTRDMRQVGHAAHVGDMRNACTVVEKPEGRRSLRRPRYNNTIKIDLKQIGCKDVDCIQLAQKHEQVASS